MSSVMVRWEGRCADPEVREKLAIRLQALAEQTNKAFPDRTSYRCWNRIVTGKILVSGAVLGRREVGLGTTIRAGGPVAPEPKNAPEYLAPIPYVRLQGVEFRLPNNFYRDEDRISFLFASQGRHVDLPWVLVQVEDRVQCQSYKSETIRNADLLLTPPGMRMRYIGEEWVNELLGWIKHYYLNDLYYWSRKSFTGYESFEILDPKNTRERELIWKGLRQDLDRLCR
jgi:hypothetical protein